MHITLRTSCFSLATATILCACAVEPDSGPPVERVGQSRALLLGVPEGGYPSLGELEMLVAMNRVRADPNNPAAGTADPCSENKAPTPPLVYDVDAGQAARFHCNHSAINGGGLSHASYCDLEDDIEANCPGAEASCSCKPNTECWTCDTLGGCGTGPSGRMTRFGFTGNPGGENGAAGYASGWAAVGGWVTENPCNSATLGHRNAVTSASPNVVGTGINDQSGSCWGSFQFADFGNIGGLAIPRIASAVKRGESFYANYYDAAGPPQAVNVVQNGVCTAMDVELGTGGNLTMVSAAAAAGGCQEYWFLAFDAAGERHVYPEAGAYLFGTGGECDAGYHTTTRSPADCDTLECDAEEICGNDVDDDCNGLADDGCGAGGAGTGGNGSGGANGGDGAGAGSQGGSDADGLSGDDEGDCGCRVRGAPRSGAAWWAMLLLGLAARWRHRSRRRK